ncbi:YicC/YloC family endoribonuclease [Acidaminococcus timonensis]|uniref:YicC/YloC family endoribonuclease n=1 Tax=Acidaminococcus timonensis TaxID=1871002 RepID=UPI0008D93C85|nr:YicC/YloC family endoribonuclease [Acidaminococcus timonensis]
MVQSMTGYGRGTAEGPDFSFRIEIKTVNHRYTELNLRMPRFLNPVENRIRKLLLGKIQRGHVDVFINASYTGTEGRQVTIDKGLAKAYHDSLEELTSLLQVPAEPGKQELFFIAGCPEVLVPEEADLDLDALWPAMEGAVNEALDHLVAMRRTEGENISRDVVERIGRITGQLESLQQRAPETVKAYRARLTRQLKELLAEAGTGPLDESRVIQETAIYADRVNVTEEMVRLHSHLDQFGRLLTEEKPVGRRMDFLVQEMNREANTIASKAGDAQMIQTIVDMKSEIEKVREQIQNIQ